MATAKPLEDETNCSICFEIYKDPHLLKCLHTFCHQCIQPLIQGGKVTCPECREVTETKHIIKKEFKPETFIEAHHSQQKEDSGRERQMTGMKCGICLANKSIKSQCTDCEIYMCKECEKIHNNLNPFTAHKVKLMEEIIKGYESTLRSLIVDLEVENEHVNENSISFDQNMTNIEIARKKQLSDVKQCTEHAMKELTKNQLQLEKMINDANDNLIAHLKEGKLICDKNVKDIQSKVELINGLLKSQDVKNLIETANSVDLSIREDIKKIKAKLPSVNRNKMISPVTVTRGRNWNAKSCVEVQVNDISATYASKWESTDISKLKFKKIIGTRLDYEPHKLCMVNNEVWCAGNNAIYVYTKDCALVKEIYHEQIAGACTLAYCDTGHVIVACINGNGLHQFDSSGKYETQIAVGAFSDTCYHHRLLYALEHNSGIIKVFQYTSNWMQMKDIKLEYSNGSNCDQMCVHLNGIYVSSWRNRCIYRYSSDGTVLGRINPQQQGTLKKNPCLCDVDSDNNVIVSDWNNNNLQMMDRRGNWYTIKLPGLDTSERIRSVLRENETLWITSRKMKLIQFMA